MLRYGTLQHQEKSGGSGPSSKLLYSRGYCLNDVKMVNRQACLCSLCGTRGSYFALLLKRPSGGDRTPGFAQPYSHSDLLYPLALGKFRETDIISNLTCCERCSSFAVDYGKSPANETLVGFLLFGENLSLENDVNRKTWLDALDDALDKRISRDCEFSCSLAILQIAIDHAPTDLRDNIASMMMLRHACKTIESSIRVPYAVEK